MLVCLLQLTRILTHHNLPFTRLHTSLLKRAISAMSFPDPKKQKVGPVIGTHNGSFHCDEALACAMLRLLPEYKEADIRRSRDPVIWETCDVLVDVGGVYDPSKHRYDHHQRGFEETFDAAHAIKLSSAGLVYKHFGKSIIATLTGIANEAHLASLYMKVYDSFIEEIDAIDNGVEQFPAEVTPKYRIRTNLSSRVSYFNPSWQETNPDEFAGFLKAMELTRAEFVECVRYHSQDWLPARSIVEKAIRESSVIHPSGNIIKLEGYCPWKDHLFTLEDDLGCAGRALYMLYPDQGGKWRVQAVPEKEGSFRSRKALPESWRGLRDDVLSELIAIPGCIFVHASGFIGGAATYDSALQMALKALDS